MCFQMFFLLFCFVFMTKYSAFVVVVRFSLITETS